MTNRDQNSDRHRPARERLEDRLSTDRVEEILDQQAWPATDWPLEDEVNREDYAIEIVAEWKRLEWEDNQPRYKREMFEQIRDQHDCLDHLEMWPATTQPGAERVAHYECQWAGEWKASDGYIGQTACEAMVKVRPTSDNSGN